MMATLITDCGNIEGFDGLLSLSDIFFSSLIQSMFETPAGHYVFM
jgi:hypothetical protein